MSEVRIYGLRKSYGSELVLDGLNLVIEDKSLTAVLGPSGSGKTTLLRVIVGFEVADSGRIEIGDEVVVDGSSMVAPERRHVGYVPQEGALFPHLDVARNVGFGLRRGPERAERVEEVLDLVGMGRYARRYPHELSGGQQQRVALARALAPRPKLLLLDEPFSSLDANMRSDLRAEIARVLRATGTTTVIVTHDQDEAMSIADHIGVLVLGRIRQAAAPRSLYSQPSARRIARFVGVANFVKGVLDGSKVKTAFGQLDLTTRPSLEESSPVIVMIRPERIDIQPETSANDEPGRVAGGVVDVEYHGHDALVFVKPDDPSLLSQRTRNATPEGPSRPVRPITELVARTEGDVAYEIGERVLLSARGPVVAWPEPTPLVRGSAAN